MTELRGELILSEGWCIYWGLYHSKNICSFPTGLCWFWSGRDIYHALEKNAVRCICSVQVGTQRSFKKWVILRLHVAQSPCLWAQLFSSVRNVESLESVSSVPRKVACYRDPGASLRGPSCGRSAFVTYFPESIKTLEKKKKHPKLKIFKDCNYKPHLRQAPPTPPPPS